MPRWSFINGNKEYLDPAFKKRISWEPDAYLVMFDPPKQFPIFFAANILPHCGGKIEWFNYLPASSYLDDQPSHLCFIAFERKEDAVLVKLFNS